MTKQLHRYVLTDELYSLLKQQILSHTLPAGEKINIDKLTRELGVSNIPIREALFRLATEGFVTVVPFKGMYVAPLSLKDIDDIFEIRVHLEELAVRKAVRHIPQERLLQMLQRVTPTPPAESAPPVEPTPSAESASPVEPTLPAEPALRTEPAPPVKSEADTAANESEMMRLNRDLHGTVLSYANNETLRNTVLSLIERIHRYLNMYHYNTDMDAERREHEAIIRAIMERDEEAAAQAVRSHLQHSHARLRSGLK